MELIVKGNKLSNLLVQCISKHDKIMFATAWASAGTDVFKALYRYRNKITYGVIGTHFYQTDPYVLERFTNAKNVRFVLQPSGVFHPKVYLFQSKKEWDIILGSANLTNGAFTKNQELCLHFSSKHGVDETIAKSLMDEIEAMFKLGKKMTTSEAERYSRIYTVHKKRRASLAADYGDEKAAKDPLASDVISYSWDEYVVEVLKDPFHEAEHRCDILDEVRNFFTSTNKFSDMPLRQRQAIAGMIEEHNNKHYKWFGSMHGAGVFKGNINDNSTAMSRALDKIPLTGVVTEQDYKKYIRFFLKAFPDGRDGLAGATRLLALKRPDYFVCLNQRNSKALCKDFGIPNIYAHADKYDHYWERIIERILDSVWWNAPKPKDKFQNRIWNGRVAMLDAIFYEPQEKG